METKGRRNSTSESEKRRPQTQQLFFLRKRQSRIAQRKEQTKNTYDQINKEEIDKLSEK